mgnify:FL=1
MEYKKINELTTVVTGGTPSTRKNEYWDNGDIPWLQSGCCQNCDVDSTEKYITKEGYNNSSTHMMSADTVMIALTGATAGKVGYLKFEACGNQSITGILPCESLNQRYLFFYLLSQREKILADCVGGAQAHISQSYVKNMTIPILAIKEQEQIVGELTKVSNIVSLRQEEIQQLDNLVKARFVELFGDIRCNNKLPLVKLSEFVNIGSSKRIYANEYVDKGVPFYRSKEIRELGTGMKPSVELYIKQERYDEIKEKYGVPKKGDILIAAIGATIGYSWIVDTDTPFYYKDGNLIILSIKNNVNPIFLNYTMRILIEDFKNKDVAGSAQLALTIEKLEKMMVVNPDIKLQNQFADFVHQVNKSKFDTMTFAPIYAIINLYLHTHFYQGRR